MYELKAYIHKRCYNEVTLQYEMLLIHVAVKHMSLETCNVSQIICMHVYRLYVDIICSYVFINCDLPLSSVALAVVVVMRRRAWNFLRNTVDGCLVLVLVLTFTCCMMSLLAVAIVAAAPTPSAFGVSVANDPPIVDKLAGASLALYFVFK